MIHSNLSPAVLKNYVAPVLKEVSACYSRRLCDTSIFGIDPVTEEDENWE